MSVPSSTLSFSDFTYNRYIVDLTEDEFQEARDIVMAMWSGVLELWAVLPEDVRYRKRSACLNLLVAWYLVDTYPTRVTGGMQSSAGMMIGGKRIRDVQITFREWRLPDAYDALGSNQFGIKAAYMLRYAPEMMGVYGVSGGKI